jgi:hypothetical protein
MLFFDVLIRLVHRLLYLGLPLHCLGFEPCTRIHDGRYHKDGRRPPASIGLGQWRRGSLCGKGEKRERRKKRMAKLLWSRECRVCVGSDIVPALKIFFAFVISLIL